MSKRCWIFAMTATLAMRGGALAQPAPPPGTDEPLLPADDDGGAGSPAGAATPPPIAASSAPVATLPPAMPRPPLALPEIITAPTGHILRAGMIYSRSALDTGGGLSSDLRVGLGDVAEFGVATTDLIRARAAPDAEPDRLFPYLTATFRMGVAEGRLFRGQPALALGFRKSFEHDDDGFASRVAELHLVGSRHLGARASVHLGGAFWDASIERAGDEPFALHDRGLEHQLRGFGGLELRPLDDALILVDLSWSPELCYACATARATLRPVLSWGVRYDVADWLQLQSGVRILDIHDADLLDAQIFGQITILSSRLRNLVAGASLD